MTIEASPAMLGLLADVRAFHAAHGTSDAQEPITDPDPEVVRLRAKLILEEMLETLSGMFTHSPTKAQIAEACALFDGEPVTYDREAVADGLADMIYVCVGAALALGMQDRFARVWTEVQRANMDKTGGARRADGKILKPEGWNPPAIAAALEAA